MGSLVIKEITNISSEGFFKRKISISFILSDSIKLDLRLFVFFYYYYTHWQKHRKDDGNNPKHIPAARQTDRLKTEA